jgi:hypothetical protein
VFGFQIPEAVSKMSASVPARADVLRRGEWILENT